MKKRQTVVNELFYILFFTLFTLSIFLVETEYLYYLFFSWSLFFFYFSKKWGLKLKFNPELLLLSIFNLLITISTYFSKLPYLSIDKLIFYFLSFESFIFFRFISKKQLNKKKFFHYFSLLSLLLNIFVIILTFNSQLNNIFPGMNILVRTYGHNHYSSFLLISIPIFWWQLDQKENLLSKFLIISSYLIMFISLGRIALLISFIQFLGIIYFIYQKNKVKKINLLNSFIKVVLFTFSLVILIFFLLSSSLIKKENCLSELKLKNKQLCQPILENSRKEYWQKAIEISKKNLTWGYGLKTFPYADRKINPQQITKTSYAHNIFLNTAAEAGITASLILFSFFIIALKKSLENIKKEKLNYFLYISILGSTLNSLIDFDFNFFVIFNLTLIFIALSLRKKEIKKINSKLIFILILIINTIIFANYQISKILVNNSKHKHALKLIPNPQLKKEFIRSNSKLSNKEYLYLLEIYKNDYFFLSEFSQKPFIDDDLKRKSFIYLLESAPYNFIQIIDFEKIELNSSNKIIEEIEKKISVELNPYNEYLISYEQRIKLAKQIFAIAETNYKNNKLKEAATAYQIAIKFDQYIMAQRQASFLNEKDLAKSKEFLSLLTIRAEEMHQYFYQYMNLYEETLIYLLKEDSLKDFYNLSEKIIKDQNNFSVFLLERIKTETEKQQISIEKYSLISKRLNIDN